MKSIAVYTAIFGNYDTLKDPPFRELLDQADFYCITDNKDAKSDYFKIIYEPSRFDDPTRDARYYKIMGHEVIRQYPISIWMDGAFEIKHPGFLDVVSYLTSADIALYKHPDRQCIYDEAAACIRLKKEKINVIVRQLLGYFFRGLPADIGLNETSLLVRRKAFFDGDMCKLWWKEVRDHSKRDQLSFNYVLYRTGQRCDIIPGNNLSNAYLKRNKHNHGGIPRRVGATDRFFIRFTRLLKLSMQRLKPRTVAS